MFRNSNIVAILFFVFWVVILLAWGASKGIEPDMRSDGGFVPCRGVGHPLYDDC